MHFLLQKDEQKVEVQCMLSAILTDIDGNEESQMEES